MGYFNDVQIDINDTPKGKKVVFRVIEKPVINSIVYEGIDELKEEDVKAAANIKEHFIVNPAKVSAAEEAIRKLYKSKGFYNSTVISKITYPDDKGADVRFVINEGKKIFIKEISVEGNVTFTDDELARRYRNRRKMVYVLAHRCRSSRYEQDPAGFPENCQPTIIIMAFSKPKSANHRSASRKNGSSLNLSLKKVLVFVSELLMFTGDLIGDKEKMLALLSIREQKFISRQVIRDNILALTDYYAESGYAFASIRADNRQISCRRSHGCYLESYQRQPGVHRQDCHQRQ